MALLPTARPHDFLRPRRGLPGAQASEDAAAAALGAAKRLAAADREAADATLAEAEGRAAAFAKASEDIFARAAQEAEAAAGAAARLEKGLAAATGEAERQRALAIQVGPRASRLCRRCLVPRAYPMFSRLWPSHACVACANSGPRRWRPRPRRTPEPRQGAPQRPSMPPGPKAPRPSQRSGQWAGPPPKPELYPIRSYPKKS